MASCWILNLNSRNFLTLFVAAVVCSGFIFSCGTSREVPKEPPEQTEAPESTEEASTGISSELITQINANRSSLDDVFVTPKNEIPNVFTQRSTAPDIGNPNEGYRVQILSTRNVSYADSIANDFRFWADDAFNGYRPEAYVLFRQPYYKVHIGNFQFYNQALKLNRFLKNKYPDAWIVHDQVEPNLVPSDTTSYDEK